MADENRQCDVGKEDISAYLDGELSGIDAARVEAHLKKCPDCAHEKDILEECSRLVGSMSERRPSPSLEAVLKRRSQDYLDGFQAKRRRFDMTLAARAWARRAIVTTVVVAAAATGIYLTGRWWSARRETVEKPDQAASTTPSVTPGREVRPTDAVTRRERRPPERTVTSAERRPRQRVTTPAPEAQASQYAGWWRVSFGSPPADMGSVKLVQDGATISVAGDSYLSGRGRLDESSAVIERADARRREEFSLEVEFDADGNSFTGSATTTFGGGEYSTSVAILGQRVAAELAEVLDSQAGAAETVAKRMRRLGNLYRALEKFAAEHNGAFPYDLTALVPAYIDDPRITTSALGIREIEYEGGLYMPSADEDLPSLADLDITPDEAVGLYADGAEQRVEPFLTELVSEAWRIAPPGRAVLYLDGTTAWESDPESVPPLPQEVIERRANQRMIDCQENLRKLEAALGNWLRDWEGIYPQNLESLYPEWLRDPQLLTCPEEELHTICYELLYSAQTRPAEEEFASPEAAAEYYATMPVVTEIGNPHLGGHNVLYMDGHVEWQP